MITYTKENLGEIKKAFGENIVIEPTILFIGSGNIAEIEKAVNSETIKDIYTIVFDGKVSTKDTPKSILNNLKTLVENKTKEFFKLDVVKTNNRKNNKSTKDKK